MRKDNFNENTYTDIFCDMVKSHKIPHAMIIEYPDVENCIKVALSIVSTALCEASTAPCGKCPNCVKIRSGYHPDVKVVASRGNEKSIKVDDIRFIRDDAYILSNEGGYKFYIIKNAEFMTVQAQNAFIKILEEPPEKVIFILLCESSGGLLDTVKSRCQIFKLNVNSDFEETSDSLNFAKKITEAVIRKDICKIMEYGAKIPNDRKFFKGVIQHTISLLLDAYSHGDLIAKDPKEFVGNLEEIKSLIKYNESNVNFNLLVSYFCACLQF